MLRALTLAGGVAGAAALSQFPEFSQQYLQRLAGKVEALTLVVAEFDASAARNDLTRDAALAQMSGSRFLDDRQADLRRLIDRQGRLSDNLTVLRLSGPLERLGMPHRLADAETLSATWGDFRPAVPLTVDGAISAALGFVAGWGAVSAVFGLLAWPFRRRSRKQPPDRA